MLFFWSRNFYGKVIAAHTDAPNDLFFGRNISWGIYHNFKSGFWEIFSFGQDMELFRARGDKKWQKIAINDLPGHKKSHILAKTKNHPKPRFEVMVNTPGNMATKEQVI